MPDCSDRQIRGMEDDDQELRAIRARRMAELQRQQVGRGQQAAGPADSGPEQRQKEDEMRSSILTQILSQEAGARRESLITCLFTGFESLAIAVNTLKAVRPDKAKMVEDILISNARVGRLQGRVSAKVVRSACFADRADCL